ncbi:MAG: LPS-assembly protein LptD [Alphaproteobacteria bacterium]
MLKLKTLYSLSFLVYFFIFINFAKSTLGNDNNFLSNLEQPYNSTINLTDSSSKGHQDKFSNPILFSADDILFNEQNATIKANGRVKFMQNDNIVWADEITYYDKIKQVRANGNIRLLQDDGNFAYADKIILNSNMKEGHIEDFKLRFKDNSLLAANLGKLNNNQYQLIKAVYSSCPVCSNKQPVWQIKADKVTFDKSEQKILYKNAYFEVYGVPILYTPYFSHATSDSEAKSGILTPKLGHISKLGNTVEIPLYLRIASNKEAILSPIFTTKKIILTGKYSHLANFGSHNYGFSAVSSDNKDNKYRGHFEGKGIFKLNEDWNFGYNFKRASSRTYLKTYKFSNEDHLVSQAYLEYYANRNYINTKFITFQSLNDFYNRNNTPLLFPYMHSHFESEKKNNSYFFIDSNLMLLTRKTEYNTNRLINNFGYKNSLITQSGHVFGITSSIRFDIYKALDKINSSNLKYTSLIRPIPVLQIDWNYPLFNSVYNNEIYLKPMANLIITPTGINKKITEKIIPNEDSLYVELYEDNLFKPSKFPGLDLVEEGTRINYGVNSVLNNQYGKLDMLVGQSYRTKRIEDSYGIKYISTSGLQDKFSDYVGKINYVPNEHFNLFYRYRIDKKDFNFQRNQIGVNVNYSPVSFLIDYVTLSENYFQEEINASRKQIFLQAAANLTNRWNIGTYVRKNLSKNNKKIISSGGNINYTGDCFGISTIIEKDFTHTKEQKKNSISYFMTLSLKNITQ